MATLNTKAFSELLKEVKQMMPQSFPQNSWYIMVATSLAAAGKGDMFGDLYQYALAQAKFDEVYRKNLSIRLREVIIKSWTLIGMPRAIAASYSLQAADQKDDEADNIRRAQLINEPDLPSQRSQSWFKQAFQDMEPKIFSRFSYHSELEWTLRYVVYGYFLGDLSVLTPIENEFVVLASVLPAGGSPSITHMKILRQLGVSARDGEVFLDICKKISQWAGVNTTSWPSYEAIES
ncbi:uncharacterized protein Z519_11931 [Cladophialophora bantiana CBS 173.52]|uniref:Carboxymuconolactone decarboxylase-like domain-containing protein n=1 Tax=Cladophialophora bantiana (strain ATCC 10958 / CBS 173.52 / CDC B-1940 / NIH 8579) TaxID=1442370 RepID=A0A0D2EBY2_CLAB1|nr:uncharacterized protein Z519_11931 [Cladophialophora bantiana CBS 173.52]KIW87606.1 hypothetical protein Z519_11931 [Cladophialophora bantiana CBS 173.52]